MKLKRFKTLIVTGLVAVLGIGGLVACGQSDADVVSHNISKDADNFKVLRRIVFYNGITGEYILQIEGYCSLGNNDAPGELSVTCKTGEDQYRKHFLGLSDNVTYFEEQIVDRSVSKDHYQVIFKPSTIIPQPVIR